MEQHGLYIALEGIGLCGKGTQVQLLASSLRERGVDVVTTLEPGGTPFGQKMRDILLNSQEEVDPRAQLLMFGADRAQHIWRVVKPFRDAGKVVLSDRFWLSTYAYQGAGQGLPHEYLDSLKSLAVGSVNPDLVIWLDISVDEFVTRKTKRPGQPDRYDDQDLDFQRRVRGKYQMMYEDWKLPIVRIDGEQSREVIAREILNQTLSLMKERNYPTLVI
jgi:dTMP kinase